MQLFGTSLFTTQFAPIMTSLPIVMFPKTFAPAKITTQSPILGRPGSLPKNECPIVTP